MLVSGKIVIFRANCYFQGKFFSAPPGKMPSRTPMPACFVELTSKVTTEFSYNGTSRRLQKERYCRIDIMSELKCI